MAFGDRGSDANKKFVDGIVPVRYLVFSLVGAALFLLGAGLGWVGHELPPSSHALREQGYQYIRPLLLCNIDSSLAQNEDTSLTGALRRYIGNDDIGVYYLNPTKAKWAGVNENESFSPASMLKVPIMTAIFRSVERRPDLLSQKFYLSGQQDFNAMEDIQPAHPLLSGSSYTIQELLNAMMLQSDNNATNLLTEALSPKEFEDVYTDLGLKLPAVNGPIDFMSPKTFTLFLRILYNGTYLSREHSEEALGLMTQDNFMQGLRAGVPKDVVVAEKFGERRIDTPAGGTGVELHDCGIVYSVNDPYLLCVMTRGKDFTALGSKIVDISRLVYERTH